MDNMCTKALEEFNTAFGIDSPNHPWDTLVEEELKEAEEAYLHLMKELADLAYVITGKQTSGQPAAPTETRTRAFDLFRRCSDLMTDVGQAFVLVHQSNMSKLQPDGSVLRREDGKVLKGPNYQPPDLSVLL